MAKIQKHAQMRSKKSQGAAVKKPRMVRGSLFGTLWEGIENLIDIVAEMDKTGTDEFARKRIVRGKTASGKEVRGEYGFRVRTGLDVIREKDSGEDKKGEK